MIQFNLLPDVKLEHIKAMRRKRVVTVVASSLMAASLTLMVLLFMVVNVVQKKHINNLTADINKSVKNLQGTEDLNKILTIQNQLTKLPELHNQKPVASRLFAYITSITPIEVSVSKFDIDFTAMTITMSGSANNLTSVNKFVDTLKFTNYNLLDEQGQPVAGQAETRAFSKVVLSSFGRTEADASYTVNFSYDPVIFDSSKTVKLAVPNTITTRSETEKPLFQGEDK